jgi:hypothetical protein
MRNYPWPGVGKNKKPRVNRARKKHPIGSVFYPDLPEHPTFSPLFDSLKWSMLFVRRGDESQPLETLRRTDDDR